jgi:hypothetical protein
MESPVACEAQPTQTLATSVANRIQNEKQFVENVIERRGSGLHGRGVLISTSDPIRWSSATGTRTARPNFTIFMAPVRAIFLIMDSERPRRRAASR